MADITATTMRVEMFEILKLNNSRAIESITIDHMSNAHGRLKTIAIDSRPKSL